MPFFFNLKHNAELLNFTEYELLGLWGWIFTVYRQIQCIKTINKMETKIHIERNTLNKLNKHQQIICVTKCAFYTITHSNNKKKRIIQYSTIAPVIFYLLFYFPYPHYVLVWLCLYSVWIVIASICMINHNLALLWSLLYVASNKPMIYPRICSCEIRKKSTI